MRWFILLTILFASVLSESNHTQSRLVLIRSGLIRGYKDPQEDVFAFYEIPYAKAPTGTQRFKAPLPAPVWFDILDAVCPQIIAMDTLPKTKKMKEDSLIANVFLPKTEDKSLSVVVYVHGGGFVLGFGNSVTPKKKPTTSGVPAWKPVGKNWSPHMNLKKKPELKGSLLKERCTFWDNIYELYYKFPIPPFPCPLKHSKL